MSPKLQKKLCVYVIIVIGDSLAYIYYNTKPLWYHSLCNLS